MEQSPSEANRHSPEIPHSLWNPNIHYHIHKSLKYNPLEQASLLWQEVNPQPNPQSTNHPLSDVCNYILNIFTTTLHIWRPSLQTTTQWCKTLC